MDLDPEYDVEPELELADEDVQPPSLEGKLVPEYALDMVAHRKALMVCGNTDLQYVKSNNVPLEDHGCAPGLTSAMSIVPPIGHPFCPEEDLRSPPVLFGYDMTGRRSVLSKLVRLMRGYSRTFWCHDSIEYLECRGPRSRLNFLAARELLAVSCRAAFVETQTCPETSLWRAIYGTTEEVPLVRGLLGTLYTNNLVISRAIDDQVRADVSKLFVRDVENGFLDCMHTSMSENAGARRLLVAGVYVRIQTKEVLQALQDIMLNYLDEVQDGEWLIHWCGIVFNTSEKHAKSAMAAWKDSYSHLMSCHRSNRRKVVSFVTASGVLARPVLITKETSATIHVDSVTYHHPVLCPAKIAVPSQEIPLEYVSIMSRFFPYTFLDTPPRPSFAVSMSIQALAYPYIESSLRCIPEHNYWPVVRTPDIMDLWNYSKQNDGPPLLPGISLICIFVNDKYNYEDSVIVSDKVVKSGWLRHKGFLYHPIPDGIYPPNVGDVIGPSCEWWRPTVKGTVVKVGINKMRHRYVGVNLEPMDPKVGDKLATPHGQKFVISKIVPEEEMYQCRCAVTGQMFRPHMIISSVSVINRGTLGQLYEGYAGRSVWEDISEFDPTRDDVYYTTELDGSDYEELQPYVCHLTRPETGTDVMHLEWKDGTLEADYGICHVWQLYHLVREKQHYMSAPSRGIGNIRGRLRGAGVRLGEMELQGMATKELNRTVQELTDASDMTEFEACTKCNRQAVLCTCTEAERNWVPLATRLNTLRLDVINAVVRAAESDENQSMAFEYFP